MLFRTRKLTQLTHAMKNFYSKASDSRRRRYGTRSFGWPPIELVPAPAGNDRPRKYPLILNIHGEGRTPPTATRSPRDSMDGGQRLHSCLPNPRGSRLWPECGKVIQFHYSGRHYKDLRPRRTVIRRGGRSRFPSGSRKGAQREAAHQLGGGQRIDSLRPPHRLHRRWRDSGTSTISPSFRNNWFRAAPWGGREAVSKLLAPRITTSTKKPRR